MKLRSFTHPANPSFDEGESLWAMFKGFRARVTLTDKRIIVSRFGHTSILYGDATDRLSNGRTRMTFRQFARCYERCIADETHNHARKAGHVRTVSESGHPLGVSAVRRASPSFAQHKGRSVRVHRSPTSRTSSIPGAPMKGVV
jgi:hypothetical protein